MNPLRERLIGARWRLIAALSIAVTGWALAIGGTVLVVGSKLLESRAITFGATVAAAAVTTGVGLWRRRRLRSIESIALWIEEHQPELEYTLITAADPNLSGGTAELSARAAAADIEGLSRRASLHLVIRAGAALLIGATVATVLGGADLGRASAGGPVLVRRTELPNRLIGLAARVTPPAYSHLGSQQLDDPGTIEALVGSSISLEGLHQPDGVRIALGPDTQWARARSGGWKSEFKMPALPAAVALTDREYRRLIVLAPRTDSAPQVVLASPLHDTTYQSLPDGPIALVARASDDIGLAVGYFEFLITTGVGDNFTTVARTGSRRSMAGTTGTLSASIRLDTLKLKPGSVLSVRAVVLDGNDVTGPGKGVSETRTLRLAEKLDTVNVAPAPPDQIDSMLISQRLLNLRTDTLIRNKKSLGRTGVADKSMTFSNVQETIRLRVIAVVTLLEDDGVGGTSPTEVSLMLRKAGEEMQAARIDLAVAQPDTARPHMRRALAILDEIRTSHRYYLRGQLRPVLVDVARVRLTGSGDPTPSHRIARDRLVAIEAELAARLGRAGAIYDHSPSAGIDSVTLIQVSAFSSHPELARRLGEALTALKQSGDWRTALAPVLRRLTPPGTPLTGPAEWSGSPSP